MHPLPLEMNQPRPFEPLCRRWVARLKFPPYRHLPGETPHPRIHPEGHSYGVTEPLEGKLLSPAAWWENEAYLFGVDLYNYAYWWEAHEQWEGLWRLAGVKSLCGLYLQGLIQVGAALIKWHQGNRRGASKLAAKGCDKLERVCGVVGGGVYMGLDLRDFLQRLENLQEVFPTSEESDTIYCNPALMPLIHLVRERGPHFLAPD